MKKTVLEMFFLDDSNFYVSPGTPYFVYRHCSTIKAFRVKRLSLQLNVSVEKLLVSLFLKLLSEYFQTEVMYVTNRMDCKDKSVWKFESKNQPLHTLPDVMNAVQKVKANSPETDNLAIKFEIKVIKNIMLFSFFYPEKPISEKISAVLLRDYDKNLRKTLKEYGL